MQLGNDAVDRAPHQPAFDERLRFADLQPVDLVLFFDVESLPLSGREFGLGALQFIDTSMTLSPQFAEFLQSVFAQLKLRDSRIASTDGRSRRLGDLASNL